MHRSLVRPAADPFGKDGQSSDTGRYQKRIRRVIANGHAYDQYTIPSLIAQWLMTFFNTRYKDASNRIALKNIAKGGMEGWQM